MRLFLVENQVRRRDELFVSMWIPHDCLFAQLHQTPFHQRPKRLVIERSLPQKLRCADRRFQAQDRLKKFCLPGRAFSQLLKCFAVDLAPGLDEQLLFPSDFRAPDNLRQQAAHHCFDRAAIVGTDPSA